MTPEFVCIVKGDDCVCAIFSSDSRRWLGSIPLNIDARSEAREGFFTMECSCGAPQVDDCARNMWF